MRGAAAAMILHSLIVVKIEMVVCACGSARFNIRWFDTLVYILQLLCNNHEQLQLKLPRTLCRVDDVANRI
jgi:hypothetical protein